MQSKGTEKSSSIGIIDESNPNVIKLTLKALTALEIGPNKQSYDAYKTRSKANQNPNFNPSGELVSDSRIKPSKKDTTAEDKKLREKIKDLLPTMIVELIEQDTPAGIQAQVLGNTLNVSGFLPIEEHANEFKGNMDIRNAIMELGQEKPLFRRIRGDGNCFFRAAVIQYFERLLADDIELEKKKIAKSRVITFVKEVLKGKLIKCKSESENPELVAALADTSALKDVLQRNVCEILFEKFFLEIKLGDKNLAYRELLKFIEDKINNVRGFDIALIVFLRSWIFNNYKEHFEEYKNFIFDDSAETILKTYGLEAENVIIPIVADALECSVTVNMVHTDYKNNKKTTVHSETYDGLIDGKKTNKDINLNMYFRPGHYECMYDRGFYKQYFKDVFGNI